jgi:hypothetical protein
MRIVDGDLEPFEKAHPEEHGVAQTVVEIGKRGFY